MIFSCDVIRRHLLSDKKYVLQLSDTKLSLRENIDQPAKYELELNLKNQISWKSGPDQQLKEFGIKYLNKIKWFTGKGDHLQKIKDLLQNKIFISGITQFYTSHEQLGFGASCKVHLIRDNVTLQPFAAKCISKDYIRKKKTTDRFDRLVNEIEVLRTLKNHPNLVRLFNIFEGENSYYIIFEYLQGETLHKYIKTQRSPLTENNVRLILQQLLLGLKKCHQTNIIHRDMKLENVVLSKSNTLDGIKIIDFGLAIFNQPNYPFSVCGTPGYIAPEILNYDEQKYQLGKFQYTSKIDTFGLGAMLYRIMTRQSLFESENTKELMSKNQKCLFVKQNIPYYSNTLNQILYGLLEFNPKKRLSTDQALELLQTQQLNQITIKNESTRNILIWDEYQVIYYEDIIQIPYLFPNRKMKKELFFQHSYHLNEDRYEKLAKSYLPSFSINQNFVKESTTRNKDFIIEQ